MAWDPEAREVWVADATHHRVGIFDWELFPVFSFGGRQALPQPLALVVGGEGDLFAL